MPFRTRRFVRPNLYLGYLTVDSSVSVCLSVCRVSYRVLSIFVSVLFVGIVSGAVTNELRRFLN